MALTSRLSPSDVRQLDTRKVTNSSITVYYTSTILEDNDIVRSYRWVIVVTSSVTRRSIEANIIVMLYKHIKNMKSPTINSLKKIKKNQ